MSKCRHKRRVGAWVKGDRIYHNDRAADAVWLEVCKDCGAWGVTKEVGSRRRWTKPARTEVPNE